MKQIEHWLRDRIGLDANAIGLALIQRAVGLRMKDLGLTTLAAYKCLLAGSVSEWRELVDLVIVTETWFFRDWEPFAALARLVTQHRRRSTQSGPVRLLSVPCSSGEEPYSMAIALLDAGLPADRFLIDAVDVSARALARARAAVYGNNSFRGKGLDFRDRYFQPTNNGLLLNPAVRHCVRFSQGNLLSENFPGREVTYDFVFCRNLLIYFDGPTRQRALHAINSLLAPSGVLFVGPAEQPLVTDQGFVSANIPRAFACRRAIAPAARGVQHYYSAGLPASFTVTPLEASFRSVSPQPKWQPWLHAIDATTLHAQPDLEEAHRLADAGHLDEATALCESHLRDHKASAHAYYLLGLMRDARGDTSAMEYYRKALYLEPNHEGTLWQMALSAEGIGDETRARTFRQRAQRTKLTV